MIGEKLDAILKSKNIKPGTLARTTGIPKSTIYSILKRNNKNIDLSVMERIADALEVPVEYFHDRRRKETEENEKKPATASSDELDSDLIRRLMMLSPEELEKVDAFVQGLLASH